MRTDILTLKDLFQKDIRYIVPEFQRRYTWKQEEQWEPLWEDVRNTAESYIEELERSGCDSVKAEQNTTHHFLGAIVVQQIPTALKDIDRRQVIDGQQRITTLQLLLDAVQYVYEELELRQESRRLSRYVTNDKDFVSEEDHIFKLWPTRGDREAFRHAMDNGLATEDFEDSLIVQAHEFFQLQAREWIESEPDADARSGRIKALETAVTGMLQMVVIDLDADDDPHVIFETLNARGTPLLQSELIKNYVMSKVSSISGNSDIWGDLDSDWWRRQIEQGRLYRPRIDMLLDYWLEMRTASEVSAIRVFNRFRSHAEGSDIADIMSEVKRDLGNYHNFENGSSRNPIEDMFHYRNGVMKIDAITPALLFLLSLPDEKRNKSLQALESYLIRRMVCRKGARSISRIILSLLGELREKGQDDSDRIIIDFLRERTAEADIWPDDTAIRDSLRNSPLYKLLTRGRLRLVLEGIEERLRKTSMAEQNDVPKNLTIEHVMPQSWETNWPLPNPLPNGIEIQEATNDRNRLVHTIGNLTLVRGGLNSALKNAAWEEKRETLRKHSVLLINDRLLSESQDEEWNEDFIQARSERMAKIVTEIWPGPDSPTWCK